MLMQCATGLPSFRKVAARVAPCGVHVWALCLLAVTACDGQAAKRQVEPGGPGEPLPLPPLEEAPPPIPNEGPCALDLTEVAVYQAVKVPLAGLGPDGVLAPASIRNADLVAGRPALIRAFATPRLDWQGVATARLTLTSSAGTRTFDATNDLRRPSTDLQFDSTFNFQVPGDAVFADSAWRLDVVSPASCGTLASARVPVPGLSQPLGARATGVLKVMIVPIAYQTDASGRLPDLTEIQLERYRSLLMSMYPVTSVSLQVRDTVTTELGVSAAAGWEDLLDALRQLRQKDRAPADLHYYGVINPAATFSSYCGRGCTAGIAYVSKDRQPALRVGVGVGFTGQFAALTLAHELGHQHGRFHSPCNVDGDPTFPYERGSVGVWGYDASSNRLIDPAGFSDIMGYCSPSWVSDFTYQGFLEYAALLQSQPEGQALSVATTWKVLLVSPLGRPRWGHPITTTEAPSGARETATILDDSGAVVATPTVYRTSIADSGSSLVWVPLPEEGWESIVVAGAQPHPFSAPIETPTLR